MKIECETFKDQKSFGKILKNTLTSANFQNRRQLRTSIASSANYAISAHTFASQSITFHRNRTVWIAFTIDATASFLLRRTIVSRSTAVAIITNVSRPAAATYTPMVKCAAFRKVSMLFWTWT